MSGMKPYQVSFSSDVSHSKLEDIAIKYNGSIHYCDNDVGFNTEKERDNFIIMVVLFL